VRIEEKEQKRIFKKVYIKGDGHKTPIKKHLTGAFCI
jgi:hypothetical protein